MAHNSVRKASGGTMCNTLIASIVPTFYRIMKVQLHGVPVVRFLLCIWLAVMLSECLVTYLELSRPMAIPAALWVVVQFNNSFNKPSPKAQAVNDKKDETKQE